MDILPSIVDFGYRLILEKAFSSTELKDIDKLALRITDNQTWNFKTERDHLQWLKSNPFGYARWFLQQATLDFIKAFSINESIKPVPLFSNEKLPLQRVVQILKRHRDIMFNGDEDKPISVIITTLAAKSYRKETDIIDALINVIEQMPIHIEERYSYEHGRKIKWIGNPVNNEENFADKWTDEPQREKNFYKWIEQVKQDVQNIIGARGIHLIQETMERPFGKSITSKAFSIYGENLLKRRESGNLSMAAGTGMIGSTGRTAVTQHKPFGANE
jgi:hypothetical protein